MNPKKHSRWPESGPALAPISTRETPAISVVGPSGAEPGAKTTPRRQVQRYSAILLVGAPGSGKGTQGKMLGEVAGLFHCSCGDVFRAVEPHTDLGRLFASYSSQGKLVPDEVTIRLWLDYLQRSQQAKMFCRDRDLLVLDGIPRNLAQARLLEPFIEVRLVINLVCASREVLLERIKRRAVKDNRTDDARDEVILNRLMVYQKQSEPMLQHYPVGRTHPIEAEQPALEIHHQIMNILTRNPAVGAGTAI